MKTSNNLNLVCSFGRIINFQFQKYIFLLKENRNTLDNIVHFHHMQHNGVKCSQNLQVRMGRVTVGQTN